MKAFLSYSSKNEEFVGSVAKELGRQFCIFDKAVFETGVEFKESIEKGLDDSAVFILFASKEALDSFWVQFELDETWYRLLRERLTKALVYIIDSSVKVDQIPEWLQRALIKRENSPRIIARDIRYHLNQLLLERRHSFFVGRSKDIDEIQSALTPADGTSTPHAIFVFGLPLIGRRSLIRHIAPGTLSLKKILEIQVGEGDSINDLCSKVAIHVEPYSSPEGLKHLIKEIQNLTEGDALKRILINLRTLTRSGELPIFIDVGGLLDADGIINDPIMMIMRELAPNDEAYIFFVTFRRPHGTIESLPPVVSLNPLLRVEVRRLISLLANKEDLSFTSGQISDLAEYVAGYPPAAYFAVHQAKNYGIDLVLEDKSHLITFRRTSLSRHINSLSLDQKAYDMLYLLASYSPLPLHVIAEVLDGDQSLLHKVLIKLLDLTLVNTNVDGFYQIAEPVADTVFRVLPMERHEAITLALTKFYHQSPDDRPSLDIARLLFRAALYTNNSEAKKEAIHLANDLIQMTKSYYNERDYRTTIKIAKNALEERPHSITARTSMIRALIKLERWSVADEEITALAQYAPVRDIYFLKGFLERNHGNHKKAIEFYKSAEKAGRRGMDLSRELGLCYLLQDELDEASKYINDGLDRQSDNVYLIDLWVQLAIKRHDEETARQAIARRRLVSEDAFYFHRLSRVEYSFGHPQQALKSARSAYKLANSPRPAFEIIAQLIYCEIQVGDLGIAEDKIGQLDRIYPSTRNDIRLALRCRLENSKKNYATVLSLSEQINDKASLYYKRLRLDALVGEIQRSALTDEDRIVYRREVARLEDELADITEYDIFLSV